METTIEPTDVHMGLTGDRDAAVLAYHILLPEARRRTDLRRHAGIIHAAVAAAIPGALWLRVESGFFEMAVTAMPSRAGLAQMGEIICRLSPALRALCDVRPYTRSNGEAAESRRLFRAVEPCHHAARYAGVPLTPESELWAWGYTPEGFTELPDRG